METLGEKKVHVHKWIGERLGEWVKVKAVEDGPACEDAPFEKPSM